MRAEAAPIAVYLDVSVELKPPRRPQCTVWCHDVRGFQSRPESVEGATRSKCASGASITRRWASKSRACSLAKRAAVLEHAFEPPMRDVERRRELATA